ncbi:cancer-related nucleoside-triphosphatase homolog isoform X2 [Pectinophora gossypiella]|uniref:cancer-related nucleoside-triphosphatase homolog isoform X2 n=1 Tax=Pectinophora gossypiella TaxID=13191 RepID=UPI00214E8BD8|nr:cancer-related nucleoside-triphosphatase homolog isoform X2 [Pectinophora gossypiella]
MMRSGINLIHHTRIGVGKTTLTKKLTEYVNEKIVKTSGFYTEEVRKNHVREGFDVVSLDGKRGRLARDMSLLGPVKYKVGKYGVLIQEFESVALPTLVQTEDPSHLLVIDEIGKMEFFSEPFKNKIKEIFSPASECVVLATIPVRRGDALIESIRSNSRAKVWTVTRENRNTIHEDILKEMKNAIQF